MKQFLINFLKFLLFLSIGSAILYFVYSSQNNAYISQCALDGIPAEECSLMNKIKDDFGRINYWWILASFVAFTISNISRAIRWNMLIKALNYSSRTVNAFLTVMLGYTVNLVLPRAGEVARAGVFARYENIPAEKVFGTIVVDRMMDIIYLLLIIALTFALEYDILIETLRPYMPEGKLWESPVVLGLAGMGILSVVLIYLFRRKLSETKFYKKIANILKGFAEGIRSVMKLDRPGLFIFHSTNIWVMYFAMTYFMFLSFPPTAGLSVVACLMVFVFGAFGIVIPSPGGMGTYHFLAMQALAIYNLDGSDGFSWAMISFFSIQIFYNVIAGLSSFAILPFVNKNYKPVRVKNEEIKSQSVPSNPV